MIMEINKAIQAYSDYCEQNNLIYQEPDPKFCTSYGNHFLLANEDTELAVVDFDEKGEAVSVVSVE
jgi:hypothetical protein